MIVFSPTSRRSLRPPPALLRCHCLARQRKGADPEYDHYPVGRIRKHFDNPTHTIRPELAAADVNELATEDAISTSDSKISTARLHHSRRLLGSFSLGSMANATPQTLVVANQYRDRQVIGFCGDGGPTTLMRDLITAATYELPVKPIVLHIHGSEW